MKNIGLIFCLAFVAAMCAFSGVQAEVIHLDGIANAGWYADTLTKSHLYIYDTVNSTYFYKWVYSDAEPQLPWSSREALNDDLADGILNDFYNLSVANWQVQSGGDAFNVSNNRSNQIWKEISFSPGMYKIRLTDTSRAYQLNEFLWGDQGNESPLWNAYVQMLAIYNDNSWDAFNFGEGSYARETEDEVLAYYRQNVDGMILNISKPGTMYFFINDYNAVDNGQSVTLEFNDPQVPIPGSLLLFGTGLAAFLIKRRY